MSKPAATHQELKLIFSLWINKRHFGNNVPIGELWKKKDKIIAFGMIFAGNCYN